MTDQDLLAKLERAVDDAFESRQVPLLKTLVETPSHTHARDDVEAAFAVYDETMAALGLTRTLMPDPDQRFADHRVYRTQAAGTPCLALVGHMDTVFPRSMAFLDFSRDDDKVFGPGSLDMKSGLTAMAFALSAVRAVDRTRFEALPVACVVVSDEEVGSPSSAPVVYDALQPELRAALVFEAGRTADKIVTGRKGSAVFRIHATGRAAHAGNHHQDGINAIHALCLLVPAIEALTDYDRGVTCNVGLMEGGTAKNTVPDRAHLVIDCRFEKGPDGPDVHARLQALCDQGVTSTVTPRLSEVAFRLEGHISRPPMEPTPAIQDLRGLYERHAAAVGLDVGEAPLQGGGSDANLLAARGVPVIDGLGPYGQHFHKVEEWSSLSSLRRRTLALARFLVDEDVAARFLAG